MSAVVVQITRGLAPARCIAHAATSALDRRVPYVLIDCKPAAIAKEEAARTALDWRRDLVLIEDDMMPTETQWDEMLSDHDQLAVMYGETPCRNGERNVYRNRKGEFAYSGTVFVKVPLAVLDRLAHGPLFEPWEFSRDEDGEPVPVRRDPIGSSSDVYFWQRVRKLSDVRIVPIGHVDSLATELNSGPQRPNSPNVFTLMEYRV